jgi:hypothetical protein
MNMLNEITPETGGIAPEDISVEQSNELTPESVFTADSPIGDFFRANTVDAETDTSVPQATPEAAKEVDNQEVRYQYWQSEADKAKNENDVLKQQIATMQQNQVPAEPQQAAQEESVESFPPPPDKPRKPSGYNKEEAWSDPSSESAKYQDGVDDWRDQMDDYNRLHNEYSMAVLDEERQSLQEAQQGMMQREQAKINYQNNMQAMNTHLTKEYGATPEEVSSFVDVMDKPDAYNIDNLFQLYRMQAGTNQSVKTMVNEPIVQAEAITNQNESFEQLKRAQQVPSPMGVLPSSNRQLAGTPEDGLMDSMVNDYNKRNPWS